MSTPSFEYILPVIRGIQAGREYYVSMCPVRFLPKLFPLESEDLPPEMRAKRTLNQTRIPEIADYFVKNSGNYTCGAIAASIDADITFEAVGNEAEERKIGRLRVPMDAKFTINDGQHRRAAFEMALRENPQLGYETVALILFLDIGLEKSQQKFADLNNFQVPLESSLSVLYNHRGDRARLVKAVVKQVEVFRCLTEMERGSLNGRSPKLFALSAIDRAIMALLSDMEVSKHAKPSRYRATKQEKEEELAQKIELAVSYWNAVCSFIPDWQLVLHKQVAAGEIRRNCVHCHSVVLESLGEVGASLRSVFPDRWEERLTALREVDWSFSNPDWEGGILAKGGISRSRASVTWMTDYLRKRLGLETADGSRAGRACHNPGG
ncbi:MULTISPECIES: DNA sulfur modification protein DndB [unclassified Microcoleus]|uniref:DNA sulfur modification protein DndB n=1 Tax=unclassified Microcoleus TaxID=2642155 RepID=UPI0025CD4286|nr:MULTISPECIES: DNA sulfur modification protein DndB [unclassified Microcoleus]